MALIFPINHSKKKIHLLVSPFWGLLSAPQLPKDQHTDLVQWAQLCLRILSGKGVTCPLRVPSFQDFNCWLQSWMVLLFFACCRRDAVVWFLYRLQGSCSLSALEAGSYAGVSFSPTLRLFFETSGPRIRTRLRALTAPSLWCLVRFLPS